MNLIKRIKRKLVRVMGDLKRPYIFYLNQKKIRSFRFDATKPNIILFETPNHINIGDHAIAEAQIRFFYRNFPSTNLLEIDQDLMTDFILYNKHKIKISDVIAIHGGGNFGNQYMREEILRRLVISHFPDNKVISFPQTLYYTNDSAGQKELSETQRIICNHRNVVLIAREQVSYQLMKAYFPSAKVILTPDIVLSMDECCPEKSRKGILMVMRNDEERVFTEDQSSRLREVVSKFTDDVVFSDMYYTHDVYTSEERHEMLDFKFGQFKSSSLVITDRLHGMVLAAITNTPCIAFSNYNQKVSGTYEWIKKLNYIKFLGLDEEIENHIQELLELKEKDVFSPEDFGIHFQKIRNEIDV